MTRNPRRRVYIAHPISVGPLHLHVSRATVAFLHLSACGFAPFCPAWSVYGRDVPVPLGNGDILARGSGGGQLRTHDEWMEMDLQWLATCHALLRLPGESKGADEEVAVAREKGIPVHHDVTDLCGPYRYSQAVEFGDVHRTAYAYDTRDLPLVIRAMCHEAEYPRPSKVHEVKPCE